MSYSDSGKSVRQTYELLFQLGPDWQPKGVPRMSPQIVAVTPDLGYQALTHAVPSPPSGYFDVGNAYNSGMIQNCGYKFKLRACDGTLAHTTKK